MTNNLQVSDYDAEEFFKLHGVGDFAVEPELEDFQFLVDKNEASPREKEFCRYIVLGETQTEAYVKAFDKEGKLDRKNVTVYAHSLLKRKRVAKYYYELLRRRESFLEENLEHLISELNADRKLARDLGQPSAAIQAVKTKANLLGLENATSNKITVNVSLSDDQKENLLARIVKRNTDDVLDADYVDVTPDD